MSGLISLISGIIFSIGLGISGMVDPNVVFGFLDLFGNWNPALVFVMVGAIAFAIVPFTLIKKNKKTFSGEAIDLPTNKTIDKKLVIGSLMFGIGWGLAGVCPGPAIANIFLLNPVMLTFIGSMIAGMLVYKFTLGKSH